MSIKDLLPLLGVVRCTVSSFQFHRMSTSRYILYAVNVEI